MIGKPQFFDPEIYASVIEQYILSDEVERAFWLLDNAPAFYRDNPTPRMLEIRESLHRQLFTPMQYAGADNECTDMDARALEQIYPPRAQILGEKIAHLNQNLGIKPTLMEIGGGSFWLPYALRARQLEFTYEYQALVQRDLPFDKPSGDNVNIFVGFELIEHLSNPLEIYQAALKFKKRIDYVYISTPLYTYQGIQPNWRENALGHLRTYTPQELYDFCRNTFRGYEWQCHLHDTITCVGELKV